MATQAIAAVDIALWDLKAKRAGLRLAKLLGSHHDSVRTYNTSGGFLHTPIEEVIDNAQASLAGGIGGIKLKAGQPDWRTDVARVTAVREALHPDVPLIVDANQQWDRWPGHHPERAGSRLDRGSSRVRRVAMSDLRLVAAGAVVGGRSCALGLLARPPGGVRGA